MTFTISTAGGYFSVMLDDVFVDSFNTKEDAEMAIRRYKRKLVDFLIAGQYE